MTERDFENDKFVKEPVLTSDGKPWCQNCYVCREQINFLKVPRVSWLKIGNLVRHKKCIPSPAR